LWIIVLKTVVLGGKNAIELFHEGKKFLVVLLDSDPRTEFVDRVAFFLIHCHNVGEVLQNWAEPVCSMSNVAMPQLITGVTWRTPGGARLIEPKAGLTTRMDYLCVD
jgi:hypothetical protein